MGAEKGYDTDESWDEDSDKDFDDMDDGDFDLDTADPDEEDFEPTLQTVQACQLGQDDAVIPYPRLYQRTFREIKRMDETHTAQLHFFTCTEAATRGLLRAL